MTQTQVNGTILKVGSKTSPKKLAGSIAMEITKHNKVEIVYIGAGAGNIVTKAVAIARGMTATQGADLWSFPSFYNTKVDESNDGDLSKVGIRVMVENKGKNYN